MDVGYFTGRFATSGGTKASAAGVILEPGFAWRSGHLVTERQAARVRSFRVRTAEKPAVSIPASEHLALPRLHPGLRDVGVYVGTFAAATRPMRASSGLSSALIRRPASAAGTRAATSRFVKGSTGGPDTNARTTCSSYIVAEASDAAGHRLSEVRLTGVNVYDFTAGILAWGAQRAAVGALQGTGVLGPVEGFGLDVLQPEPPRPG